MVPRTPTIALLSLIENDSIVVLHSGYASFKTADQMFPYVVNRNFYYMSGIKQENVILVMGKNNDVVFEKLFIEEIDEVKAKWTGRTLSKKEASDISGVEEKDIMYLPSFENFIFAMFQNARHATLTANQIYLDLELRRVPLYTTFSLRLSKKIKDDFPAILVKNCYRLIVKLRTQKQPEEVELMVESIETTNRAILNVMKHHNELTVESLGEAYHDFILIKEGKEKSFNNIIAASL